MRNKKRPVVLAEKKKSKADERLGLLDIKNSEFAKLFYINIGFSDAEDFIKAFALQINNDVFLYNMEDCTFWFTDSATDIINGVLLLVEENRPLDAFTSFAYSFHKLPVALYSCAKLRVDILQLLYFYTIFTQPAKQWGPYFILIAQNTFFNAVDIVYEGVALSKYYEEKDYTEVGSNFAKILSDIFFKSPVTESWNYKNSDALNGLWGDPNEFYKGFVRELNGILVLMDLEPLTDDLPDPNEQLEEVEEELDEFGEPIVRSSRFYTLSRSEKLKRMKICL